MGTGSKRKVCFYMMVDGQPVAVEPEFAEITYTGEQRGADNPILDNYKFSVWVKLPKSMRCRSRKRFVKLLMASGVSRNAAQALARDYVAWSNRLYIPECLKETYQGYFTELWLRGIVRPAKPCGGSTWT